MEKKKLKRKMIKSFSIYAVIAVVICVSYIFIESIKDKYNQRHSWLSNDISSLNRKLDGFNKKTLEFSEAVKVWDSLPESRKKGQGLRISDAKELLDSLEKKYFLHDMRVSFSKPYTKEPEKDDTVEVIESSINIAFGAVSDVYAIKFLNELIEKFPGYVQVSLFSMTRSKTVSKDILKQIASGQTISIVDCKINLKWHDLKQREKSDIGGNK